MPKYNVLVTVDTTMSAQVEVEADDADHAEQVALTLEDSAYVWEHDDGFASDPFIADPGNCAEEVT